MKRRKRERGVCAHGHARQENTRGLRVCYRHSVTAAPSRQGDRARSLLACLLCHSLLMQPLLSDYSREGGAATTTRRGEESQPSSQPGFRGVARVADRRGRRREGKARHFKIAFLLFEVQSTRQRKSSHIHTTDCGLRTTTNSHASARGGGGI